MIIFKGTRSGIVFYMEQGHGIWAEQIFFFKCEFINLYVWLCHWSLIPLLSDWNDDNCNMRKNFICKRPLSGSTKPINQGTTKFIPAGCPNRNFKPVPYNKYLNWSFTPVPYNKYLNWSFKPVPYRKYPNQNFKPGPSSTSIISMPDSLISSGVVNYLLAKLSMSVF